MIVGRSTCRPRVAIRNCSPPFGPRCSREPRPPWFTMIVGRSTCRPRVAIRNCSPPFGPRCSREQPMQKPFAVIDAVAMIAIDPDDGTFRCFGDKVIATQIVAVPPAGLDAFGSILQRPGRLFQAVLQRLGLIEEP